MKLAEGYDDGSFRPGEAVSRQELAVMVNRAAELAGLAPAAAVAHPPYVDEAAVSPWAKAAVEALTGQGLLSGLPDGSFAPAAKATRAECLTLLDSLLARLDFSN
ncbi:hypothetical protein DQG13_28970 [Paenibacillus sp. YN15]|nr:hypothetical protein DQG13_28970 [Paenibacillus sp. YN15]